MKIIHIMIMFIHIFVGIAGIAGGYATVSNPQQPFGLSPEILKTGPFDSFLIPGLILLLFVGTGNIAVAVLRIIFRGSGSLASIIMGGGLMVWILVQCLVLQEINGFHMVFFCLGSVQGVLALTYGWFRNQFPFSAIKNFLGL